MLARQEAGVCIAFGGTNARSASCVDNDIVGMTSEPTPVKHDEFMGWTARKLLNAAHGGAEWAVIGLPGPVTRDGQCIGPFENVVALKDRNYNLMAELTEADPAVSRIADEGFKVFCVNDGELAAHAAATKVSKGLHDVVGAFILGTGVGAGIVRRHGSSIYRADSLPYEIGHIPNSKDDFTTIEDSVSGTAITKRTGKSPEVLPPQHKIWEDVGQSIGHAAIMLSMLVGTELIVTTGGVGSGAYDKYSPHLQRWLDNYIKSSIQTQREYLPVILPVSADETQVFELYGAFGVAADFASGRAA